MTINPINNFYSLEIPAAEQYTCTIDATDPRNDSLTLFYKNKDTTTIKDLNEFKTIIEYIPYKVYGFVFNDNQEIKTICDEEDEFDLEFAFYLAIAKKKYSKTHTLQGVINKAKELSTLKYYNKIVQKGMKLFTKQKEEELRIKQEGETKKLQHKKYIEKKKRQKERKRQEQINIIAEAIRKSKEEG